MTDQTTEMPARGVYAFVAEPTQQQQHIDSPAATMPALCNIVSRLDLSASQPAAQQSAVCCCRTDTARVA